MYNKNFNILDASNQIWSPQKKLHTLKALTKQPPLLLLQSHSYKTYRPSGSYNNWCFSFNCLYLFLISLTFYEFANKWSLFRSTFLPKYSSSRTLIIFPLLFFGKLFNQFMLPWGQILAHIKHFNLLWHFFFFNLLWKWEDTNTFPDDAIDFSNMTLLFFRSPHTWMN